MERVVHTEVPQFHKSREREYLFLFCENEEIDGLSPAELLAGRAFEQRTEVRASQERLLGLSFEERVEKVNALLREPHPSFAYAIG